MIDPTIIEQILPLIKKLPTKQKCWFWQGDINYGGYGTVYINKTIYLVHRLTYEFYKKKKIKKDRVIDHLCRNRSCCNPDHLQAVTPERNTKRGKGFKRLPKNIFAIHWALMWKNHNRIKINNQNKWIKQQNNNNS